jgi:hypothetical protein
MINQLKYLAIFALLLFFPTLIFSQVPPPLGAAADFAIFTSIGAATAAAPLSQITGDVGSNSAGGTSGFGNINGTMHTNDGSSALAATDLSIAYANLGAQIPGATIGSAIGGGQVLLPDVYFVNLAASLVDSLILDGGGDPNACFVFQIDGALTTAASASIILRNGTNACNVFWRVSGAVTMEVNTFFKGTIIAEGAIDLRVGVDLEGRALSTVGAVTVSGMTVGNSCGIPTTGPVRPVLNAISCFAIFTTTGTVTNTGTTNVFGDIGTNSSTASGFNPGGVVGTIHSVPDLSTEQGEGSLDSLYIDLNSLTSDIELLYPAQFGNSQVLTPNVYVMNAATTLTDTIYLNSRGDASAIFVIRIMGALTTGASPQVILLGGTQPENVFWQVEGAVTISSGANFNGIIVANNGAIVLNTGVVVNGKALSTNGAITSDNANVTSTPCSFPLPIELLSFTASAQEAYVELNWSTASEQNNDYFSVERSTDGINFTSIMIINGAGNSTENLNYSVVDDAPLARSSYYRLKQTDYDGKNSYSNIEAVEFNESSLENYPNPFSVATTFHINQNLKEASLIVYNSNGQIVKQIENISGETFTLARENLLSGFYFIRLVQDGKIVATDKLVITD